MLFAPVTVFDIPQSLYTAIIKYELRPLCAPNVSVLLVVKDLRHSAAVA